MAPRSQAHVQIGFPWAGLPNSIKTIVYEYAFIGACSTYLFAPGDQTKGNKTFAVANTTHINLLRANKETWRQGREVYFRVAKVVFRGYEKMMNDSIPMMKSLVKSVVELHVPLHFVRWMLLRRNLQSFESLIRLVMEDLSVRGFEIEGDNPSCDQILTALYKKESEIAKIYELLVDGKFLASDRKRQGCGGIQVMFHFEIFSSHIRVPGHQLAPGPSKVSQLAQDSSQTYNLRTSGKPVHRDDRSKATSPSIIIPLQKTTEYTLNVRTKTLTQIGQKLRFNPT